MIIEQIKIPSEQYTQSLGLRQDVLRTPLGLDIKDEDLSDDIHQIHFGAFQQGTIVGIVILVPHYQPGVGKLRQMATSPEVRGKGIGIKLVEALETYANANDMPTVLLHAREVAMGFYEKLGYTICSEPFEEVGIKHFKMKKMLSE